MHKLIIILSSTKGLGGICKFTGFPVSTTRTHQAVGTSLEADGVKVLPLCYSTLLRPGSRVCNSMQKITEIVKDYGGVANGCQSTEVWPGGQKTSNEG